MLALGEVERLQLSKENVKNIDPVGHSSLTSQISGIPELE
jgi:hypothetical protein